MAKKKSKKPSGNTIALNKKARFDFHLTDKYEAGIALQGWEVKSLRAGKGQLTDCYVVFERDEAWLLNCQITPINTISTHFVIDPMRKRKLLLHRREIDKLQEAADQKGHTIVALSLYWKNHMVKCQVAIAKGKKQHDKRDTEKQRDWDRQKARIMRHN